MGEKSEKQTIERGTRSYTSRVCYSELTIKEVDDNYEKNETTGGIRHCENLVLFRPGVMSPHPTQVERRVTIPTTGGKQAARLPEIARKLPASSFRRNQRHRRRRKCERCHAMWRDAFLAN